MTPGSVMEPVPGKCNARTKSGGLCRKTAGAGTEHKGVGACELHCGNTASANRSAARQIVAQRAQEILERLGRNGPTEIGSVPRLLILAREYDDWLDATRELVRELQGDFTAETLMQGEIIRAAVVLYTDALERVQKLRTELVRLGLDERRVRAEEAEVALLARAVDVMLARVVPAELHERCRGVLAAELRRLDEQPALPAGQEVA